MAELRRHGIGILGLGVMGREMAASLQRHPRFRVVGAYDPAPGMATDVPCATSAAQLAGSPEVDCLYVASPPAHHAAGVAFATRHRKAVLCEKPLAPTRDEAEAMRNQVESAGLPAAVNFYFAAAEAAVRLRRLAAGGTLGEIRAARLTLRFKAWPRPWQSAAGAWLSSAAEGGFTREVCSHFLFQAGRMFGPGRCAMSRVERGAAGTETAIAARIAYRDVTLEIDGKIGDAVDDYNRFEVIGSKGRAALVDWERLEYDGPANSLTPIISMLDALADMLDGRTHELAQFAEGAAVVDLIETMLA